MPDPTPPNQLDPAVAQDLARIALELRDNPKTRKTFLNAVKEVRPNFQLPADLATAEIDKRVDDKLSERDLKDAKKENEQRLARQRAGLLDGTLIDGRIFTEEQVKDIEKTIMEPRGIADYESGALIYAGSQKPASPTPEIPSRGTWTLPKVSNPFNTTALRENAFTEAHKVIDELNANRRRA